MKLFLQEHGNNLHNRSVFWCKFRYYVVYVLASASSSYIVLATIDRYAVSFSLNSKIRQMCQMKVARRLLCLPLVIWLIGYFHMLIWFDLIGYNDGNGNISIFCNTAEGFYTIFYSAFEIVCIGILPSSLMLIFGLLTIYNLRQSRQRTVTTSQAATSRISTTRQVQRDSQLLKMLLIQVIFSIICELTSMIGDSYDTIIAYLQRTDRQVAIDSLLTQICRYFFYANYCKSFYLFTMASPLFRKTFKMFVIKKLFRYDYLGSKIGTSNATIKDRPQTQLPATIKAAYQNEK
ncbi:unnamed protein product [Didymodactylos carnosus]|uniref:G-protein coupled receptors family 1 profile domain-containing protein n=1 Tax=Didymodactylos carnosus TaxID=1234261 RepID=A0A8S2VRW6_9BILA|nr:unnamed protein product [Didymodactylos carnosus]